MFWQLSDFWWTFSGCFVKTAFYLSSNFLMESKICYWNIDWFFFWRLGANSQSFGETAFAQLYKLLSTCPKEKRLCCPTFEEKILFLKVFVVFNGLADSEQNPISFFSPNKWQGSRSCILGVQKNISRRKTYLKKLFFFISFFGFWTKSTQTFPENFLAEFKKSVLRVRRNSLWQAVSQKKLRNKNFSRNFLANLGLLMENFRPFLSKLHSSCQATFWWKAASASEMLISNFFWHLAQTLKVLAKLLPAQLYKLLSTCLKRKKIVSSNFWAKTLVSKVFVNLHDLTDS